MSMTISVRINPLSGRKFGGQRSHDLRNPRHIPDYVNKDKIHMNSVLIQSPEPESVRAVIAKNRKLAGQQKLRADAQTTVAGIITFGKEAQRVIESLPTEVQNQLIMESATKIVNYTNKPLLGIVVHRDESAIHAHFTLRAYSLVNGREEPWRFGIKDTEQLQDISAEPFAHLGIKRGTPKKERIARGDKPSQFIHRSVRQLHDDLPREIAELEEKIAKNESYLAKAEAKFKAGEEREARLIERIKDYEARIDKLKATVGEKKLKLPKKEFLETSDAYSERILNTIAPYVQGLELKAHLWEENKNAIERANRVVGLLDDEKKDNAKTKRELKAAFDKLSSASKKENEIMKVTARIIRNLPKDTKIELANRLQVSDKKDILEQLQETRYFGNELRKPSFYEAIEEVSNELELMGRNNPIRSAEWVEEYESQRP